MLPEENFLQLALDLARQSAVKNEVPVGAIIVKENKIISKSFNTRESNFDPTGHAECSVIRDVAKAQKNWRLEGCDLYVTLEPCVMCLAVCQQARLRKVVYGAKDLKGGAISLGYKLHQDQKLNHRFEVEYIPMPECESILSDFFKNKRKEKSGG